MPDEERLLFGFDDPQEAERWVKVNDGVMGGLSQSDLAFTGQGTAVFAGRVSLENYGGFASVRTHPYDYRLGGYEGIALRIKGDGKRYQLRLRADDRFDGPAYQADFDTQPDAWMVVRVPLSACVPTYHGRRLQGLPDLDAAQIRQIGLLIADKQEGPFRLEIDWIKAYRADS